MSASTDPSQPPTPSLNVKEARLRANPAYELVMLDRLSEAERHALSGLAADPDCYGVLRPREGSSLSLKAVSRDTALLLFSLQQPGPLPRYAAQTLGDDCQQAIARMLLDGILEIEANGKMVSGPEAAALLFPGSSVPGAEAHIAAISRRAVEYAAALQLTDPMELSARLYAYNHIPASPRWRQLLPEEKATAKYLGLEDGPAAHALSAGWQPIPESAAWISWQPRSSSRQPAHTGRLATNFKLYVSPACHQLREAVLAVAEMIAGSKALQWKVGKGLHGLLRPDKIVVYFHHFTDLQDVALKIMSALDGCPAHGVPFTAELGGDGLLSWGIDPPGEPSVVPWLEAESWRGKVCNRLALALVQAANSGNAARFAVQRLRLEGIDTETWTPAPGFAWES